MSSTSKAPAFPARTVVLVFDDLAATVNIQEVFSNDADTEVLAVFRKAKGHKAFIVNADKQQVATMLGRRQEAGLELLDTILAKLKQHDGDVTLSRQDLQGLFDRAGQDPSFTPQEYLPQMGTGNSPVPEGYLDDELVEATQQNSESENTPVEPIDSGYQDEDSGTPSLGLVVDEEEAA